MRLFFKLYLRRIYILTKAFVLYSLITASSYATVESSQYLVMGLGNQSCKSFLNENETGQAYYLSWLAGYMTSYNYTKENTYSILGKTKTINQVELWLTDYCTVNGNESFESAVRSMLRNLKLFRLKKKP